MQKMRVRPSLQQCRFFDFLVGSLRFFGLYASISQNHGAVAVACHNMC